MTREVWQDAPPFAVGETPATDEASDRKAEVVCNEYRYCVDPCEGDLIRLISTAIKSEREQTISECIEAVQDYGLKFSSHTDEDAEEALALLIGKKDSPCSIITSVIDKYWDELGWGDRSNNMDWVDKMVADIEAALVKAGLL